MYAKCGSLVDARRLLDGMPERSASTWTAMIAAYARHGFGKEALTLYYEMQQTGIQPDQYTFSSVLPAFADLATLKKAKEVHEDVIRNGFQSNIFVGSALVDMYVKCKSLENARHVFDKMPERNVVSWTSIIAGYIENEQFDEALNLFRQMQLTGVRSDSGIFANVLPACANLASLQPGKEVHEDIIRSGFQFDMFVESALVDMYAKCGSIEDARKVFDKMPWQDVVSWTAMIVGYAMHGWGKEALELFEKIWP